MEEQEKDGKEDGGREKIGNTFEEIRKNKQRLTGGRKRGRTDKALTGVKIEWKEG